MVFSDHTACTDPANIVGGAGGGGGGGGGGVGGGGPGPSATSFFSHQLYIRVFLKKMKKVNKQCLLDTPAQ